LNAQLGHSARAWAPWLERSDWVFIIGEIGVNHNGRLDLALQLIDVAAQAGADAVKFQTYQTSALVTATASRATYQVCNLGEAGSQADMLLQYELSHEDYQAITDHCASRGIRFISTPFDFASADFLEELGVDCFKVSSGDLTFMKFLQHLARKGRPIILSSGMADLGEVEDAIEAIESVDPSRPLAVLHCVSNYPCAPEECNLRAIDTLAAAFPHVSVGWSDHAEGLAIGVGAAAREGVRIIEKHFTLDRMMEGPDHKASLAPEEFRLFVESVRQVRRALGTGRKLPTPAEAATALAARRVLVAARELEAGRVLHAEDIAALRAGEGLPPKMEPHLIGRRLNRHISRGAVLSLDLLDGS
jgi:N,N'-diacetyllegionaminate synthase